MVLSIVDNFDHYYQYKNNTIPAGFEPATSRLTAWHSKPTELRDPMCKMFPILHIYKLSFFLISFFIGNQQGV